MNARAFIIAIEDYPDSTTLAQQLPGTNRDAEAFRNWLIKKKGVDKDSILACAGPACAWRTTGTTRKEIVAELRKLSRNWLEENNDELYFYFSGHGFSYEADSATIQIDVFVASDFISTEESGDACLLFQEIQKKLLSSLGPGNHYYFIDACRNPVSRDNIDVTTMGKIFPTSDRGRSKYYALYSTALGQVAKVNSKFTEFLLQGLNGGGIAKKWEANRMYVTFERLRDYLKSKMKNQEIDANLGADGDGFIMELNPVPENECEIIVTNAAANDSFTLKVSLPIGEMLHPFQGKSHKIKLKPFDYFFEINHASDRVVQINPTDTGSWSLYDPVVVEFRKQATTKGEGGTRDVTPAPSRAVNVTFEAAPNTEVHLVSEDLGTTYKGTDGLTESLLPGKYITQVIERGLPIGSRSITITSEDDQVVDLLERPKSKVRERILKSFSHAETLRYAEFSETLGSMANWDLSLWLSIFGASHIVSDPDSFSLLKNLPIDRFENVKKNDSPVYVLAGFEKSKGPFNVSLSDGAKVKWNPFNKVRTLAGIYEKRIKAKPGSHLLSFRIEEQSPITMAVHCLPNRATFITLAEDAEGRLTMHQYLLPIYRLFQYLDPRVLEYVLDQNTVLGVVRTMALVQSRFANNHQAAPQPGTQEKEYWDALMYGKWIDPIMCIIACYEMIRRGEAKNKKDTLRIVINNLRIFFPGIPDTEVIARLTRLEAMDIVAPPLLMDGVLALEDSEDKPILSASKLDYASPWTTWRGMVSETATRTKKATSRPKATAGNKATSPEPKSASRGGRK